MIFKVFAILLLSILAVAAPGSASKAAVKHHLKFDTSNVAVRKFNATNIKKYNNDTDFNYHVEKAHITAWDRFWEWVWHIWINFWNWVGRLLDKIFGGISTGKHAASVMKVIILGILAFAIVFLVFKLMGINLLGLFKKKTTDNEIPYSESLENIHEISFDDSIESALAAKNYRLAIRLLYLQCLKQLSDRHLIDWKLDKTNTAYLNELTNAEQRRQFSVVTRQFEYVWYGDFKVDGQSYQAISTLFTAFKQQLP